MISYQIPKGLFDVLPAGEKEPWQKSSLWQGIESIIRKITLEYGFEEIRTPMFEKTELFQRGIGESSDIVTKEMYTFLDKKNRSMTLRPEGTAPTLRAFLEHHMANLGSLHKLYYIGPMFRYERPQSGRYRQHHQFGVEAIGLSSPEQDGEVIDLLWQFYRRLGLKNLELKLNTVGDHSSRETFRLELQKFLQPHFSKLSEESQQRFTKNPLRILDSKSPQDQEILQTAPSILNALSPASEKRFEQVCKCLDSISIPYSVSDKIVRGLDYYKETVFEVTCSDLGAQSSIGGGGRYDGLIHSFGGPDLPAIGFGTGLERVLQALLAQNLSFPPNRKPFYFFIPLGEEEKEVCFRLASQLRHLQIPTEIDLSSKKIQASLKRAEKLSAHFCLIMGSEEREANQIKIKEMETRKEETLSLSTLIDTLQTKWKKSHE